MKKNFKLKPSLNKTKKKEKYTSAVPVSPWNRIKIKGIRIKVETLIKDFTLSTFKFEESKTFDDRQIYLDSGCTWLFSFCFHTEYWDE